MTFSRPNKIYSYIYTTLVIGILLLISIFTFVHYKFGSISSFAHNLNGEKIYLQENIIKITDKNGINEDKAFARIVNTTGNRYSVIGVTTSCGCTTVEQLPVEIPANGTKNILLKISRAKYKGNPINMTMFTTCAEVPQMRFVILGDQ